MATMRVSPRRRWVVAVLAALVQVGPASSEAAANGRVGKSDPADAGEVSFYLETLPDPEPPLPGRTIASTYPTAGDRRSRGNLLSIVVTPDIRGANGSAATLTTAIEYDPRTNRPERITDPRDAVTAIERAPSGLPLQITRAQGEPEQSVTQVAYDDFGRPTRVINPNGHATDYLYVATGPGAGYLEREILDPAGLGLTTRYETDALGRPTAVIDPRGVRHEAVYNELGRLVEHTTAATPAQDGSGAPALGYRTGYVYDQNGNLTEERQPFGSTGAEQVTVFREYGGLNELRREEREIAPGGERAVWQYDYDASLRLSDVTDPEQHVEEIDYDPRGLPVEIRRGLGAGALAEPVVHRRFFDPEGRLARVTDPRGYVWLTGRDGYGRVAGQADPLGNATFTSYDLAGDPAAVEAEDAGGTVLSRTELEHDALGRPTVQTERLWQYGSADPSLPDDPASALSLETRIEYDAVSNPKRILDPLGRETKFEYDAAERPTARADAAGNRLEWTLDRAGNPVEERSVETVPGGGGTVTVATTRAFDGLGRLSEQADAHGNRTLVHHDARGNVVRTIDPEGYLTTHGYDGLDRRVSTVRPEGISETFVYDKASRLTTYRDALGHQTSYARDAADRLTGVTYPDQTTVSYQLDPAGNVERWTDPMGTVVEQEFDAAGRLRLRVITPGAGVVGATSEGYDYDGLSRLTRALSGAIVTELAYDSLGRVLADTTAGKTVRSEHDETGNPTRLLYPSGLDLAHGFDALDRLTAVGTPAAPGSLFTLAHRGPGRRATASYGNGLTATWSHDPAGRTLTERYATAAGDPVLAEALSWTPRGLTGAVGRADAPGEGWTLGYDGAGQLLRAARGRVAPGAVPNNSTPAPPSGPEGFRFAYDPAQSLLQKGASRAGIEALTLMPPDASGRNRPAALLGAEAAALTWNPAGQLAAKGDLSFEYDYRGRLIRARRQGVEIARYDYDAFNRKIFRTVEGVERQTVWSGLRPVEDYQAGQLLARRTYGPGLDEIVRMEIDLDGDGVPEQSYVPLYDHAGNLAVLTGAAGLPIEKYRYAPFGPAAIEVDAVAPQVTQARVLDQEFVIECSEGLTEEALLRGLAEGAFQITVDEEPLSLGLPLGVVAGGAGSGRSASPGAEQDPASTFAASGTGDFSVSLPVVDGPLAGRRLVVAFAEPPAEGAAVIVTVHPEAIADAFLNRPSAVWSHSFTWPAGDAVLADTEPPRIERVVVVDGQLEVLFSEPPDPVSAQGAILLDGESVDWTASDDGYGLVADALLGSGTHQLEIGAGVADLAGNFLTAPVSLTLDLSTVLSLLAYEALNPRVTEASAVGNAFGFHGLELDRATGLIYARNRWYDPQPGRFLTTDPLGYVDGPNLYGYALNNPVNFSDPMGLEAAVSRKGYFALINPDTGESRIISPEWAREHPSGVWFALIEEAQVSEKEAVELIRKGRIPLVPGYIRCAPGETCIGAGPKQRGAAYDVAVRVGAVPVCGVNALGNAVERVTLGPGRGEIPCPIPPAQNELQEEMDKALLMLSAIPAFTLGVRPGPVPYKRVGRWMSPEELAKMRNAGRLQEGSGGQTRLIDPPDPNAYRAAPPGDIYVEFDLPAHRVLPHSEGTGRVPGPNSRDARVPGRLPADYEMPEAINIEVFK